MKLKEITKTQTGLVLNRKKDKKGIEYKILSAKHINEYGEITGHEYFQGTEDISKIYMTKQEDIIMKIAYPNNSIYISSTKDIGLLVSSYFFIIRCIDKETYIPKFLNIYFNSDIFKNEINKDRICSTVKAIKLSTLNEINLPKLTLDEQRKIIEFSKIINIERKKTQELIELKKIYHSKILSKMIGEGE